LEHLRRETFDAPDIFYCARMPTGFGQANGQGSEWKGWQWEGLGVKADPELVKLWAVPAYALRDEAGHVTAHIALWEMRIHPPPPAKLRLHILWRPYFDDPDFRREIHVRGAGEGLGLGDNDRRRLWQAFAVFDLLTKGGRPRRAEMLTPDEIADVEKALKLRADYPDLPWKTIAKSHIGRSASALGRLQTRYRQQANQKPDDLFTD